jgi:hypothetical protein
MNLVSSRMVSVPGINDDDNISIAYYQDYYISSDTSSIVVNDVIY